MLSELERDILFKNIYFRNLKHGFRTLTIIFEYFLYNNLRFIFNYRKRYPI